MKSLKDSVILKIVIITVLALLLLIPANMIKGLIREREMTQYEAINEVSSKWGTDQTLIGPILSIPYHTQTRKWSESDSSYRYYKKKGYMHFLPEDLEIASTLSPEKRKRGIYDIVVYNSALNFNGSFKPISAEEYDIPKENIQFDKAFISVGINDLRGIEDQITLTWNKDTFNFNPGTVTKDVIHSGINVNIPLAAEDTLYQFSFSMDIKGSQRLYFTPVGKNTTVTMESPWPNPSFNGAFLPDEREVSENGFTSTWNVINLNRNFPQTWCGSSQEISQSTFGVDLLLPVDGYQKSTRTIKYALLFIALTFMTFFFVEILKGRPIHPIQYTLVGLALVLFYTLLISISEHLSFNPAYLVSSMATIILISLYINAVVKSKKISLLIGGILIILYGFIFIIIQLQSYSLLVGSVGLFFILAIVMYLSRRIDWYNVKVKRDREKSS